jgi:hypothetical protein
MIEFPVLGLILVWAVAAFMGLMIFVNKQRDDN